MVKASVTNSWLRRLGLCSICRRSCCSRLFVVLVIDGGVAGANATVSGPLVEVDDAALNYEHVARQTIDGVRY